jgi:hypothetical protein
MNSNPTTPHKFLSNTVDDVPRVYIAIVMYAKGHYGEGTDKFDELKVLMGSIYGMTPGCVSDEDIIQKVMEVFNVVGGFENRQAMRELVKHTFFPWWGSDKDKKSEQRFLESMLSFIRHTLVDGLPFKLKQEEELVKLFPNWEESVRRWRKFELSAEEA